MSESVTDICISMSESVACNYHVEEEYPKVIGVPTCVLKCGEITSSKLLILIIPGNPGVAEYYVQFMKVLFEHSHLKVPVWCISHAGHGELPRSAGTDESGGDYFNLQGQIKHKVAFVKEHIPADTRVILIGHSIGCYIILHMLRDLDSSKVIKGLLLFPTIERMALSTKGVSTTPMLKYFRWLAPLPMYPVYYLIPNFIKKGVIQWYFKGKYVPQTAIEATKKLANPSSIRILTNMANEEMQKVVDADHDIIEHNIGRLMFYYGTIDGWCPVQYYKDMVEKYPSADIQLCKHGFEHAFVLESSCDMGKLVWKWIVDNVEMISKGNKL